MLSAVLPGGIAVPLRDGQAPSSGVRPGAFRVSTYGRDRLVFSAPDEDDNITVRLEGIRGGFRGHALVTLPELETLVSALRSAKP